MARSNFNGGDMFVSTQGDWVTKECLRTKPPFLAILAQVEVQFPGYTASAHLIIIIMMIIIIIPFNSHSC